MSNNNNKRMSEESEQPTIKEIEEQPRRLNFNRGKTLICHIMQDSTHEIDVVKTKVHKQEFMWRKRIFAINDKAIWIDKKGIAHSMFDFRYTDGQFYLIQLEAKKKYVEKCIECSNTIGIDSQNARDLLKRKTISAIWGTDNSHIMLLMIMAIILLIMAVAIMYMYGETQKLNSQIIKQTASETSSATSSSANLVLPFIGGFVI